MFDEPFSVFPGSNGASLTRKEEKKDTSTSTRERVGGSGVGGGGAGATPSVAVFLKRKEEETRDPSAPSSFNWVVVRLFSLIPQILLY